MKIETPTNITTLSISLRNLPLAIFYLLLTVLTGVLIRRLDYTLNMILPVPAQFAIASLGAIWLLYVFTKALFGKGIVRISQEKTVLYHGVFGIGYYKTLPTSSIKKVTLHRKVVSGRTEEALPYPNTIHQYIILYTTNKKYKYLSGQTPYHRLARLCDAINEVLEKL